MLNKTNKPRSEIRGVIYPYLIQIDSKGIIMSANDHFESLVSCHQLSPCIHKNIATVFEKTKAFPITPVT